MKCSTEFSRRLKVEGKWNKTHRPCISRSDMAKIQSSPELDCSTPSGLQNKVFIDIMMCFSIQGRENMRNMRPSDFCVKTKTKGQKCILVSPDAFRSTERGGLIDENYCDYGVQTDACMLEMPYSERCPVKLFLFFVSKLNPHCPFLWQKPKKLAPEEDDEPWFLNTPVGVNTIGTKVREISKKAGCSKVYTHQSLKGASLSSISSHSWAPSTCVSIFSPDG